MVEMDIKDRIKALRIAKCLTQTSLSSICQIPQISLSSIERAKYKPNLTVVSKLASTFQVNTHWLETGKDLPFNDLKGVIELNHCRERASELSAISIISIASLPFVFCEKERCLIFEISHDCHIIIYLCEPLDRGVFMNIGNCRYLREVKDDVDLRSPYVLSRLFAMGTKDKGSISYQDVREAAVVTSVTQTEDSKVIPPYRAVREAASSETASTQVDTNKVTPPYRAVRRTEPAADVQIQTEDSKVIPPYRAVREAASSDTASTQVDVNKVTPPYRAVRRTEPAADVQINEGGTKVKASEEAVNSDILLAKVELLLHNDPEFSYKLKEFLESYKRTRR
ncbi:MAG: helix-turn-helix domain-containing protein [Deltaproteobacteria bacterium]|nr:helix-turn-helix domain-containing protein [Deltaproteobacteria bacterium]